MDRQRHRALLLLAFATAYGSYRALAETQRPCKVDYQNENQIDYTLRSRVGVAGVVVDSQSGRVPGACVAVFSEPDHKFVLGSFTDSNGRFTLPPLRDGSYRLLVKLAGFAVANAKLTKIPEDRSDSPIRVHMRPRGTDTTSYIEQ